MSFVLLRLFRVAFSCVCFRCNKSHQKAYTARKLVACQSAESIQSIHAQPWKDTRAALQKQKNRPPGVVAPPLVASCASLGGVLVWNQDGKPSRCPVRSIRPAAVRCCFDCAGVPSVRTHTPAVNCSHCDKARPVVMRWLDPGVALVFQSCGGECLRAGYRLPGWWIPCREWLTLAGIGCGAVGGVLCVPWWCSDSESGRASL